MTTAAGTDWDDFLTWHDGLPDGARAALARAAELWSDDDIAAEAEVRKALAIAPDHLAARVGAYKFYFYKNRLAEAVPLARWCVDWAAQRLGLPADWRQVQPSAAAFSQLEALPRLFLFSLKAYGYIQVRLGAVAEGRAAVAKVAELDPRDLIGAGRLLIVIDRGGDSEQDGAGGVIL